MIIITSSSCTTTISGRVKIKNILKCTINSSKALCRALKKAVGELKKEIGKNEKIAGSQRRKLANPNHIVKTVVDPLVAAASRSMERMEREQHGQHGSIGDSVLDDQTVDQIGSNLLPYFQDNSFENVNSENLSSFSSKKT